MNLLVTGGTGFLGRHLLPRLATEHRVRALCRRPLTPAEIPGATEVVTGDVLDPASLAAAMRGCHAVVHAAGAVSHRLEDAEETTTLNLRGTENALAAAQAAGVVFFLHISTSGTLAISERDRPATEDSPPPTDLLYRWPYYRSKYFAEKLVFEQRKHLRVASLNPSLLLGPGDTQGGSTRAVRLFLEGRLPGVPPGGLSFVDVRDVADAALLCLKKGRPGQKYLLGSANMTFHTLYQRLARIARMDPPAVRMPGLMRHLLPLMPAKTLDLPWWMGGELDRIELEMASHFWYLDNSKAREELGWVPRDPNETLRDTVADILGGLYQAS